MQKVQIYRIVNHLRNLHPQAKSIVIQYREEGDLLENDPTTAVVTIPEAIKKYTFAEIANPLRLGEALEGDEYALDYPDDLTDQALCAATAATAVERRSVNGGVDLTFDF